MNRQFRDRTEAGQLLARKLTAYANRSDVMVLALPRGGVPVAFEVAKVLSVPLDICLVRKLGVPGHKELAMGAIAKDDVLVIDKGILEWLGISREVIEQVATIERQELQRRDRIYRGNRAIPNVQRRTVILVDDGIATGSTMRAAIATLRQHQPAQIVVAVPVASASTCRDLTTEVEKVVYVLAPEAINSISCWYANFSQTTDEEVCSLLAQANNEQTTAAPTRNIPS
ncbi:phosphoribosyltransferase [Allocoleopsis franciscana]|uniref:Putative phosphoribosyltransferase n=1 Tax=Allocoleopsis franciscana PCC 7113 TaxID=1173027 RepID=K9WD30_9CYAN|nr:phosphoribosyltransferase [Allocoleopsis franciscana]AFZ17649.1 putative phosphoribosyltransferase [Allocoleopsis franciscana PCC 7113]